MGHRERRAEAMNAVLGHDGMREMRRITAASVPDLLRARWDLAVRGRPLDVELVMEYECLANGLLRAQSLCLRRHSQVLENRCFRFEHASRLEYAELLTQCLWRLVVKTLRRDLPRVHRRLQGLPQSRSPSELLTDAEMEAVTRRLASAKPVSGMSDDLIEVFFVGALQSKRLHYFCCSVSLDSSLAGGLIRIQITPRPPRSIGRRSGFSRPGRRATWC